MGMAKAERKSSRRPWSYHGLQYAEGGCRSDRQLQNTPVGDALGFVRIIYRFPGRCDKIPIALRTRKRIELRAVNPQWVNCFAVSRRGLRRGFVYVTNCGKFRLDRCHEEVRALCSNFKFPGKRSDSTYPKCVRRDLVGSYPEVVRLTHHFKLSYSTSNSRATTSRREFARNARVRNVIGC